MAIALETASIFDNAVPSGNRVTVAPDGRAVKLASSVTVKPRNVRSLGRARALFCVLT